MDEAEEIFISTETQHLRNLRHFGLAIFLSMALLILVASLLTVFAQS